ncbi:GTA protein ORFG06 [Roseibacterium elongatum DSM 19469]|uniref:GTA protein ORFG06 n=2 Tax=Roseicyclus elongatus TaxID=159346 RepID=W8S3F3_9RHOB|nr:GTA protein ORFG06 [Roseibacterium elongatum DSM 19469]
MMMVELTSAQSGVLPIAELADHLRLSRGFTDDADQDARLESCLRAAASAIEARTGKALFRRRFLLTIGHWSTDQAHRLPIAPVAAIDSLTLINRSGAETVIDPAAYHLQEDAHRPQLIATGMRLPPIPTGGSAEIAFTAGFADDWPVMPADLSQALLLLAGEFYGQNVNADEGIPFAVSVLIEPHRSVRLRGAGA